MIKGSTIATINTSRVGLLAGVVLALYYVFHDGLLYLIIETRCTGSSPCFISYPVLVEQSCFEHLVPQTPQPPLHVEQTETSEVITVGTQN